MIALPEHISMAILHITDLEAAINHWREVSPSPDGITLAKANNRQLTSLVAGLGIFAASIGSFFLLPSGFLPAEDSGRTLLGVELPPETRVGPGLRLIHPQGIVVNGLAILSEVPLLRTAKRRGIRTVAVDPSWDNFTNKLIPVRQVDRLVVWNDIMKSQAIELHGYRDDMIRVAGAPQGR